MCTGPGGWSPRPGTPRRGDRERVDRLAEALALWRAEPLTGLSGEWAARTRHALRQLRVDAVLAWSHAHLRLGNAPVVIDPLTDLVGRAPAGGVARRGADARAVRGRPDQRGPRPVRGRAGAARRGARHRSGTRAAPRPPGDPARRAVRRPHRGRRRRRTVVPAQLPMDVDGFTGRADELARLDAAARAPRRAADRGRRRGGVGHGGRRQDRAGRALGAPGRATGSPTASCT